MYKFDNNKKKFYVTTPIYYVTAKPHLGSLYSTLLADVACRWYKLKNYNTFFLTGTDEHGQKVAEAAFKANMPPQEFVDSFISDYKKTWNDYNIVYDDFIRTTNESHVKAVQFWLKKLIESGDIYKSFYSGFYCTPCETYVTEKDINSNETVLCSSCARETKYISEESYFFRLSAYQDRLLKFYEENPDFIIPQERLNEVISFVKQGLKDLSISRTTVKWGIPFPEDNKHVTYVWADALNNYITAIGYGNPTKEDQFNYLWPADLQIIGKDILRFHAVYWPAFLMASELALPKHILAHGWIIVNKQKMSKSLGNVIDPQVLLDNYGSDIVRYYLTRYMAVTQDSEFSIDDLERHVNSDLADALGNLLNRMIALSYKHELYEVKAPENWSTKELELRDFFWSNLDIIVQYMQDGYFYMALSTIFKFINQVNSYFHYKEPWKIKNKNEFNEVISATCHSIYSIAILLWPVMPVKMEQLLKTLNINLELKTDLISELSQNRWDKTFMLNKSELLFKKFELNKEKDQEIKQNSSGAILVKDNSISDDKPVENIKIEDLSKVMILTGTIISCQEVPKSDKLYKLQVDFGAYGIKQIVSGIKKSYSESDLIGQQNIFVFNLEPRKIFGLESHGMILVSKVSENDNKIVLVRPIEKVQNGTRLS